MLTISVDTSRIVPALNLGSAEARRAARLAGSSALRAMRAEASRQIRERKAIKVAAIGKAVTMVFPPAGQFIWTLRASGAPMPVIAFSPRQTKKGVSVEINVGRRVLIRGAFIATMKSGHTGVFYRMGKKRLPISEAFTSRVSEVLSDAAPLIAARGFEVFRSTFSRVFESKR
jgi:hypothetical protein